jgi:hypothetical protein
MDYLLFFFAFFFFVAMTLFLGVGDELRQGFKLRVDRVLISPGLSPPCRSKAWHKIGSGRNEKAQIVLIFLYLNGYSDCD